ncbi:MAG TPA: adenosine kinase [Planctomycetaceae bacterium]|nr:adenosine kinase [Planctomycetaceae bacterium]
MKFDVYGIGNSLVDIQAQITDDVLERLGFRKGVMTLVDERTQQRVLGALEGRSINRCAGGSAANTVIAVAQFGGTAAYAGKVGRDPLGDFFLNDMREAGVVINVPPGERVTGTCVVLITEDAQRTMLTHLGTSADLGPDDVDEQILRDSRYVYVEGYLFTAAAPRAAAKKAIEMAKTHDVAVALTVSDPSLVEQMRDEFWELIRGPVDLLFCNLEEAQSLTGQDQPLDCAHAIHQHAANVALTLGKDGSLLLHDGRVTPIEGVQVDAVDTTGAGDMYAAGLLYGLTHGLSWRQAGRLASHAAARIVSQLGARLTRPLTSSEIAEIVG